MDEQEQRRARTGREHVAMLGEGRPVRYLQAAVESRRRRLAALDPAANDRIRV